MLDPALTLSLVGELAAFKLTCLDNHHALIFCYDFGATPPEQDQERGNDPLDAAEPSAAVCAILVLHLVWKWNMRHGFQGKNYLNIPFGKLPLLLNLAHWPLRLTPGASSRQVKVFGQQATVETHEMDLQPTLPRRRLVP
ncbi:hypothetical protein SEMRO_1662_G289390.1 [Seminavis robusta]|uniref:Uncharacterized protein n=1 Tax=Seminavis robusta TaxID=568900 RepID=A0A9N8EUI6_9STRA|nr:hypothetical protein SEMRO_1662_G289390.1 [Seminavis robusta]|eukprot:Sro1662_g289390.1 n/a (140) ;mRNA; f:4364-4783